MTIVDKYCAKLKVLSDNGEGPSLQALWKA
jgi:hypothetical protein